MGSTIIKRRRDKFAAFHEQLRLRGFDSYDQYLASEQWAQFKKWYASSDWPQSCLVCGDKKYVLHHWRYENVAQEELHDVFPLCETHHHSLHRWIIDNGADLQEVINQFIRCFGFDPAAANSILKRNIDAAAKKIEVRRCASCGKKIPYAHPKDNCWHCFRDSKKTEKDKRPQEKRPTFACSNCGKRRRPNNLNKSGVCTICVRKAARRK